MKEIVQVNDFKHLAEKFVKEIETEKSSINFVIDQVFSEHFDVLFQVNSS